MSSRWRTGRPKRRGRSDRRGTRGACATAVSYPQPPAFNCARIRGTIVCDFKLPCACRLLPDQPRQGLLRAVRALCGWARATYWRACRVGESEACIGGGPNVVTAPVDKKPHSRSLRAYQVRRKVARIGMRDGDAGNRNIRNSSRSAHNEVGDHRAGVRYLLRYVCADVANQASRRYRRRALRRHNSRSGRGAPCGCWCKDGRGCVSADWRGCNARRRCLCRRARTGGRGRSACRRGRLRLGCAGGAATYAIEAVRRATLPRRSIPVPGEAVNNVCHQLLDPMVGVVRYGV